MRFWQNNKVWCVRLWHFDTSINVKQSSKPSVHHDQTIPAHELCLSQTVRKKVVGALHQHRQAMVVLTWQRRKTTTAERWSRWHWHRPTRARPPPPPTCAPTTSTSSATASSHIETTLRWIPASAVQLSIRQAIPDRWRPVFWSGQEGHPSMHSMFTGQGFEVIGQCHFFIVVGNLPTDDVFFFWTGTVHRTCHGTWNYRCRRHPVPLVARMKHEGS